MSKWNSRRTATRVSWLPQTVPVLWLSVITVIRRQQFEKGNQWKQEERNKRRAKSGDLKPWSCAFHLRWRIGTIHTHRYSGIESHSWLQRSYSSVRWKRGRQMRCLPCCVSSCKIPTARCHQPTAVTLAAAATTTAAGSNVFWLEMELWAKRVWLSATQLTAILQNIFQLLSTTTTVSHHQQQPSYLFLCVSQGYFVCNFLLAKAFHRQTWKYSNQQQSTLFFFKNREDCLSIFFFFFFSNSSFASYQGTSYV